MDAFPGQFRNDKLLATLPLYFEAEFLVLFVSLGASEVDADNRQRSTHPRRNPTQRLRCSQYSGRRCRIAARINDLVKGALDENARQDLGQFAGRLLRDRLGKIEQRSHRRGSSGRGFGSRPSTSSASVGRLRPDATGVHRSMPKSQLNPDITSEVMSGDEASSYCFFGRSPIRPRCLRKYSRFVSTVQPGSPSGTLASW